MRVFFLWSLFRSILDRFLMTFGSVFGTILGSKLDPKSSSKFDRFWDWFFIDFGSFWAAKLWPCWRHFWQKWSEPVGAAWFLSCRAVFNRILALPGPILDRFWTVRNRFWTDFGQIFGRFWADVGCFCGDFWLNFDPTEEAYVGRFWGDFWLKFFTLRATPPARWGQLAEDSAWKSIQNQFKRWSKKGSTKLFQLLKMGWWGCAKRKEFQSKIVPKATNSNPKWAKNRPKIGPKSVLDGPKSVQNRSKIDPGSAKIHPHTAW